MTADLTMAGRPPIRLDRARYVIGRGEDCDILLPEDDPAASRRHAVLVCEETGSWAVVDLGSRNGTYVNGARVQDRQRLDGKAEIVMGRCCMTITVPPPAQSPADPLPPPRSRPTIVAPAPVVSDAPPAAPSTDVPPSSPTRHGPSDGPAGLAQDAAPHRPPTPAELPASAALFTAAAPPAQPAAPRVSATAQPYAPPRPAPAYDAPSAGSHWVARIETGSLAWRLGAGAVGGVLLSFLLPWGQIGLFGFGVSISYAQFLLELVQHIGLVLEAMQRAPTAMLLLLPAAVAATGAAGALATARLGGILSAAAGAVGAVAGIWLYVSLTNQGPFGLAGLLGAGFFLFVLSSLALAGAGAWRLVGPMAEAAQGARWT